LSQTTGIQNIHYGSRRFQLKYFAELAKIVIFSVKILLRFTGTPSFTFARVQVWALHVKNITGLCRLKKKTKNQKRMKMQCVSSLPIIPANEKCFILPFLHYDMPGT